MPTLTVSELTKTFGSDVVLSGVTFNIEPKEKVALVGRNGSGKTTILRLIAGLEEPDRGAVALAPWARAAYLAQIPEGSGEDTVWDHVLTGAADIQTLETRLRNLEALMANPSIHDDPAQLAPVMEEYGTVHDHFVHAGGFTLDVRAAMVLSGLGFADSDRKKRLATLSGGWRVRTELARVLLAEPDLLLLDEPTNHLDLEALEWLQEYLREFPGAMIVVSHDRYLIDAITARTLELEERRVTSYPGAYSNYIQLKAEMVERQRELVERQQEEIAKLEAYIRRYKAGNRATMAKSREKRLSRVQQHTIDAPRTEKSMRIKTSSGAASGKTVLTLRGVAKQYGQHRVLEKVDLLLFRGERIGLLGANGVGKSTLLRVMAGLEEPTEGRVAHGTGVRVAYFAQEPTTTLDPENSVLDEVLADRAMTPEAVRTYLGRFLFSGDDVFKQVSMLSGGERQRLSLAKMLLDEPNLLLLDEPTNHLDIPSREALEAALREFTGTIVVATHDRYLLERLTTRILTIENGNIHDFRGTYHELSAKRTRDRVQRSEGKALLARHTPPKPGRKKPAAVPTFEELAGQIADAERDLETVSRRLGDPELYHDPEEVKKAQQQYKGTEGRLAELYALLESLESAG